MPNFTEKSTSRRMLIIHYKGGGSKNPDCPIFAQNPEKDLKDLWPRFIFEIAFADSGRKCLRDLLKSLLCIHHRTLIAGGLAVKVFQNTKGEITKVVWHLVSFILDAIQDSKSTKHRDMEPFQLYAKLPHPPKTKGKWIPSEGEQADIGDDIKANVGTKFRTYQDPNSLGARYYADAAIRRRSNNRCWCRENFLLLNFRWWLSRKFQIDKNSLSPEYDVIIDPKALVEADCEPFRLPANAIWVEVCHQHWIHETQKRAHSEERDVSEKRYRTDMGNSIIRTWDPVKKEFVRGRGK